MSKIIMNTKKMNRGFKKPLIQRKVIDTKKPAFEIKPAPLKVEPVDEPINEPVKKPVEESINEPVAVSDIVDPSVDESVAVSDIDNSSVDESEIIESKETHKEIDPFVVIDPPIDNESEENLDNKTKAYRKALTKKVVDKPKSRRGRKKKN